MIIVGFAFNVRLDIMLIKGNASLVIRMSVAVLY